MLKQTLIFTFLVVFAIAKGQIIDTPKSALLFKDGVEELKITLGIHFEKKVEINKYYQNAITKFLAAFNHDTTNASLGMYLPNLYFNFQKFDSSLLWSYKLLRQDSINYVKGIANDYLYLLENIGNCYLLLGDLKKSNHYLKRHFRSSQNTYYERNLLLKPDFETANFLFLSASNIDKNDIYKQLRKNLGTMNIKTCDYAIDILKMLKEIYYSKELNKENDIKKIDTKIAEVKKNCK